jgi:hypothetical protein
MVYVYLAVDENKRIIEWNYARVFLDDRLFSNMINRGAERVLIWGTDVDLFDWHTRNRDTELEVAENVARVKYCDSGELAEAERPTIALLEKNSGKWGATCTKCRKVVCKPMEPKHLPMVIVSGDQHMRLSH